MPIHRHEMSIANLSLNKRQLQLLRYSLMEASYPKEVVRMEAMHLILRIDNVQREVFPPEGVS